jgi:putative transposase
VYLWADGIHLKVRLEQGKVCLLVIIGVALTAARSWRRLADGFSEWAESWADLLHDCKRCGMRSPVLAVRVGGAGVLESAAERVPELPSNAAGGTRSATLPAALTQVRAPGR